MENLKQKLLDLKLVKDNEYLDKYIELIELNKETEREKFKTQKHHIIPRVYYKHNNLKLDNSKENLVNLLYKDHILAHYYLSLCCVDEYSYLMFYAIAHILGNMKQLKIDNSDYIAFTKQLDKYQCLYENSKQKLSELYKNKHRSCESIEKQISSRHNNGKPWHSTEARLKMSNSAKNKSHSNYNKDVYHSQEYRLKISESKQFCGNGHSGKVYINNGKDCKCVYPSDYEHYKSLGYILGRITSNEAHSNMHGKHKYSKSVKLKCVELDLVFNGTCDVFNYFGKYGHIYDVINGTRTRCLGYTWEIIKDE